MSLVSTDVAQIAVIPGDGIGPSVTASALAVCDIALRRNGRPPIARSFIRAGATYFLETRQDIEPDGEERAGEKEAIFLGAIGLPDVRHPDGTEISPHLRLRDRFELYAGIRPIKAYPNGPRPLADERGAEIDLTILRESTEGLFYSAAVHGRAEVIGNSEVRDTLRITRSVTTRLHKFAFRLAAKRRARGKRNKVTCVDKANVFTSMAFFRSIFDEVRAQHPDIPADYAYVDAMALELIRRPWDFDVLVTENMFGDILSDLAGGLVGGMGMASCAELGDDHGLFQPAHGSAPDIAGQDKANPLAAILSGAMMLDYLGERREDPAYCAAGEMIEDAVEAGFVAGQINPAEFGGPMGTRAVTECVMARIAE